MKYLQNKNFELLINLGYQPSIDGLRKFLIDNINQYSVRDIAYITNRSLSTVETWLKELNIKNPRKVGFSQGFHSPTPPTPKIINMVRNGLEKYGYQPTIDGLRQFFLNNQGFSTKILGMKLGIKQIVVRSWLKRLNLPLPYKPISPRNPYGRKGKPKTLVMAD